ncbi:LOW QUALITY PROTEIN: ribosome biogenesis protein NOP53 [Eudromia elegans]
MRAAPPRPSQDGPRRPRPPHHGDRKRLPLSVPTGGKGGASGRLHPPSPRGAAKMAAPGGFLGLGPASRPPGAARPRARGRRHRKKGWKRWAGPEARLGREIGDFLEDVALQERAAGGLLAEQPDESLFFVDTGSARKAPLGSRAPGAGREKPLRIELLLQPQSRVPPPKNILPPRPRGTEPGRLDPLRGFYDIWADDNPLEQPLAGQDPWFLEQTKKQRVKRPERLRKKPLEAPAVEVIPAGGSYNPAFEDHQALLLRAHTEELRKQKAEEKLEKQLSLPAGAEIPTPETRFQEECEGLLEESDAEDEEPEQPEQRNPQTTRPKEKKTEQQRRREKEARAQAFRKHQEKAARCRRQQLFRLRSLRLQVTRWEAELLRRRQARQAKRRLLDAQPRRLGRLKYEAPSLEVQLSDELPESLRVLKPEGSVLRDRFKSLQRRSLIEPRERARFKRKYRLKYVEKRAFREVT